MNPLRAGVVKDLTVYPWSSYPYYTGMKQKPSWLETGHILAYFDQEERRAQTKYRDYIDEAVGAKIKNPLDEVFASSILGSQGFIEGVKQRAKRMRGGDRRNIPSLRALKDGPSLDAIRERVRDVIGGEDGLSKKFCIHISHRFGEFSLKEIGAFYDMNESAVCQASRRFKARIMEDPAYKKLFREIVSGLGLSNVET